MIKSLVSNASISTVLEGYVCAFPICVGAETGTAIYGLPSGSFCTFCSKSVAHIQLRAHPIMHTQYK